MAEEYNNWGDEPPQDHPAIQALENQNFGYDANPFGSENAPLKTEAVAAAQQQNQQASMITPDLAALFGGPPAGSSIADKIKKESIFQSAKESSDDRETSSSRKRRRSRSRSKDRKRRSRSRSKDRRRRRSRSSSKDRSSRRDRKRSRSRERRRSKDRSDRRKGRSIFRTPSPSEERRSVRDRVGGRGDDRPRRGPPPEIRERNARMLFVRGLTDKMTQSTVMEVPLFQNAIDVKMSQAQNGGHRGFCHITFATPEEVDQAMQTFEAGGLRVLGQSLYIDYVGERAKQNDNDRSDKKARTLFLRAVPYAATEDDIRNATTMFHKCSYIKMAYDEKDGSFRGFAHVEYPSRYEAEGAMRIYDREGLKILGKKCFIDYTTGKMTDDDREARKRRTIFVRSIPYDATEELVKTVPCFRSSVDIRMARDPETQKFRGFCHVEFKTQGEADAAMIYYDNRGVNILGKSVHCDYVGDNARQTPEQKEMARIKAEQKRQRKRESDALEKLLTQNSVAASEPASGMNALDQLLADAKAGNNVSNQGGSNRNTAQLSSESSGISSNNRHMQALQSGQIDGGSNQGRNHQGKFDPYSEANSYRQRGGGSWQNNNSGGNYNSGGYNSGGGGGWKNQNNGGYNSNRGYNNNSGWNNQNQGNSGWGNNDNSGWGQQQEAPKKKPNPNMGGLLI